MFKFSECVSLLILLFFMRMSDFFVVVGVDSYIDIIVPGNT